MNLNLPPVEWDEARLLVLSALSNLEDEQRRQADRITAVILAQRLTAQRVAIYCGGMSAILVAVVAAAKWVLPHLAK